MLGTLQYKDTITAQKHDYNNTRTRLQHKNQHHEYLAEASDYNTTKAIQGKNTITTEEQIALRKHNLEEDSSENVVSL